MSSIVGLFGSSMTMGLVIAAFVIGLVVMWYIRGLFGTIAFPQNMNKELK